MRVSLLRSAWLLLASARLRWLGVLAATEPAVNDWRGPPVALVTVKVGTAGDKCGGDVSTWGINMGWVPGYF